MNLCLFAKVSVLIKKSWSKLARILQPVSNFPLKTNFVLKRLKDGFDAQLKQLNEASM